MGAVDEIDVKHLSSASDLLCSLERLLPAPFPTLSICDLTP